MKNALIIFIKNPVLGKVKTRLAKTIGDEKALEIYHELTAITRQNAEILIENQSKQFDCAVFYSDFVDKTDEWSNAIFQKHAQIGDDLGDRMATAFHTIFAEGSERAVIIGSDCPTLSTAILQQAFDTLDDHDFVVGPSTDGGYYLLGMRSGLDFDFVFQDINWSTDQVLPTTLAKIREGGFSAALLPDLTDVDEEKDWLSYKK